MASTNDEERSGIERELTLDPNVLVVEEGNLSEAKLKPSTEPKQDTTETNSVSKFNFVFYYIYKMKYTEDASGNEKLEYEF